MQSQTSKYKNKNADVSDEDYVYSLISDIFAKSNEINSVFAESDDINTVIEKVDKLYNVRKILLEDLESNLRNNDQRKEIVESDYFTKQMNSIDVIEKENLQNFKKTLDLLIDELKSKTIQKKLTVYLK